MTYKDALSCRSAGDSQPFQARNYVPKQVCLLNEFRVDFQWAHRFGGARKGLQ